MKMLRKPTVMAKTVNWISLVPNGHLYLMRWWWGQGHSWSGCFSFLSWVLSISSAGRPPPHRICEKSSILTSIQVGHWVPGSLCLACKRAWYLFPGLPFPACVPSVFIKCLLRAGDCPSYPWRNSSRAKNPSRYPHFKDSKWNWWEPNDP